MTTQIDGSVLPTVVWLHLHIRKNLSL